MIKNAYVLFIVWLLFIVSYVSNYFRYKYLLSGGSNELIKIIYSGFWYSTNILALVVFLIIVVWFYTYLQGKLNNLNKFIFIIIGVISIFISYFANKYINLEFINYTNYTYSKYGITKNSLTLLFGISLIFVILSFGLIYNGLTTNKKLKLTIANNKITPVIFLSILVWYSLTTMFNTRDYYAYSNFSFYKQFENYKSINILKEVPVTEKIVLPPQSSKWPDIGNAPVVRYFLYPRLLISSTYINSQELANELDEIYFIELLHRDGTSWPTIDENSSTIDFQSNYLLKYKKISKYFELDAIKIFKVKF